LDLASQGFRDTLRIGSDAQGLILTHDMRIEAAECSLTLVQRALPGATPDSSWTLESAAHIDVPADCGIQRDPDRPGDLRIRGSFLEVYVQRSNWCGGLELKMVFAQENPTLLSGDELIRRYAAGFNQRDAGGVANLFAVSGSLVEPFTESATGTTRHEGRTSVLRWYLDAFSGTPWLAMQLQGIEPGAGPGQFIANWNYMDPRLEEAMVGENLFTVAAGEIFETEIRLSGPTPDTEAAPESDSADAEGSADSEG
jgi:hypothetical protein